MAAMRVESIEALRARKADRRTEADDLRLELDVRQTEALALCDDLEPYVRRLDLYAKEHGPAAQATVNAVAYHLTRFRRQWTPDTTGDAA